MSSCDNRLYVIGVSSLIHSPPICCSMRRVIQYPSPASLGTTGDRSTCSTTTTSSSQTMSCRVSGELCSSASRIHRRHRKVPSSSWIPCSRLISPSHLVRCSFAAGCSRSTTKPTKQYLIHLTTRRPCPCPSSFLQARKRVNSRMDVAVAFLQYDSMNASALIRRQHERRWHSWPPIIFFLSIP